MSSVAALRYLYRFKCCSVVFLTFALDIGIVAAATAPVAVAAADGDDDDDDEDDEV